MTVGGMGFIPERLLMMMMMIWYDNVLYDTVPYGAVWYDVPYMLTSVVISVLLFSVCCSPRSGASSFLITTMWPNQQVAHGQSTTAIYHLSNQVHNTATRPRDGTWVTCHPGFCHHSGQPTIII